MVPEYQKGAPTAYKSQFDIAQLPDEVFEVKNLDSKETPKNTSSA